MQTLWRTPINFEQAWEHVRKFNTKNLEKLKLVSSKTRFGPNVQGSKSGRVKDGKSGPESPKTPDASESNPLRYEKSQSVSLKKPDRQDSKSGIGRQDSKTDIGRQDSKTDIEAFSSQSSSLPNKASESKKSYSETERSKKETNVPQPKRLEEIEQEQKEETQHKHKK